MSEENENGNTLKYRIDQVEICCKANKLSIDNMAFLLEYADQIRELKLMREYIDSKKESDKWNRRLLIAILVGSFIVPIIMHYLEG